MHVPIGLIHTSWGGTIAEAWTSEASLRTMSDFDEGLNKVNQMATNLKDMMAKDSLNAIAWNKALAENNNNYASDAVDTSWHTMQLPTLWENAGFPDLDGIVWFKRTVDIPDAWAGKSLKLSLGPIDDNDITFLNGGVVDSTMQDGMWTKERNYTIPANLVKTGKNTSCC